MAKTESKPTGAGKCGRPPNSAYLELMKEDEDWRQLEDASERRKIQNRLAQRAYRRNLRSRNKEVEALREQLMRFREADGKRTSTVENSSNSNRESQPSSMETRSKASSSRGSPKTTAVQKTQPNEWMPSGYENHQFFDSYQDSDDSISFASGTTPGSQQPIWPNMNDCTVTSLLHTAVAGGYMETVRLILDHWPELAHVVDAEGYTAVQRAIMSGRDDLISMFVH
ncbi:hypothetical protein PG991_008481 [Apiospora marii]|uniref:BZIP domain-containing protein n=1 Tax=Apiospora marii TaxID=335849 RepID=A0ABR1RKW8_9PEZI